LLHERELKQVPEHWRAAVFLHPGESLHCTRDHYKHTMMFARHDIRPSQPAGSFNLW
jgi:hypothetical protein